jgi:FKBP-type peptidyl-prolyl cis-trans isomerase
MKHTTRRLIQCACAGAVLLSAASHADVQGAPTAPAAAGPGAGNAAPPPPALSNEQASYIFGLTLGESLHGIGLGSEVQSDQVARGVKDAMAGKKSTPAERQQVQDFARSAMMAFAGRNKTAADAFLAKNGKEKGVQTTASGLQYKINKPGDAKAPAISASDEVTVNYRGKLIDGTEFDSSYQRGQPAKFPANGVIKGWQEALVMMKPGANWTLYVPPDLAYGPSPRPGIPPNSLLIFDIDLIGAKPAAAGGGATAPGAGARPQQPPSNPQ